MNFIKNNIPNAITLLNLLCGCIALVLLMLYAAPFPGLLLLGADVAAWFVIGAMAADFLDGFAARLLNAKSKIGKELDSLADLVSFGVVPGIILVELIHSEVYSWLGLLVPICAAIRLAKFNTDERQNERFLGLPTPANALFIISFPLIMYHYPYWNRLYTLHPLRSEVFFSAIAILCSALMVIPIPLFSLKVKDASWANNKTRYIFAALSIIGIALLHFLALPLIILLYVALSVVENILRL